MAGSVVGGGGGGGGGGADALKPLIDALEANSKAINDQGKKQGEDKLAKMMEDVSEAIEQMALFINKLNESIAGLSLAFSTLSGALYAAAKVQSSQKVKPLTAKQQAVVDDRKAKADSKALAQDKNLAYKREKDDKLLLSKQIASDAKLAASIIKAQLSANKRSAKPQEIMGPFPYEEQVAENRKKDAAADKEKKDQKKFEAELAKLYNEEEAARLKVISDAAAKVRALEAEASVEIEANIKENQAARIKAENETTAEIQANLKETAKLVEQLAQDSSRRANDNKADEYLAAEAKRKAKEKLEAAQQERNDSRKADEYLAKETERQSKEKLDKKLELAQEERNDSRKADEYLAAEAKRQSKEKLDKKLEIEQEERDNSRKADGYLAQEAKRQSQEKLDKKLRLEQQERDDSRKADTYLRLEARRKQVPLDAAKAKAAEEKGASAPVLGVDLGAIGYKMEEFGKAATLAGETMTAAGKPVGPMFMAVASASKYLGTTLRIGAMVAKGLIAAFSWLRSTVSALAKSVAVYAPAISQMAEMALRDMSAVMGAAGVGVLKAFTPIIRSISDRMFPVSKDMSDAGGDVVKSFAPLIDGIMAILMPTVTVLIQLFRGLWYTVGPMIKILGVLVQALGLMWGVIMSVTSVFLDWLMPVFKAFADNVSLIVNFFQEALKMLQDKFAWLLGKRGEDALTPASTVGLAAAQSAKMGSFQSLGESAAQNAFLTSTGGRDPQADLAQDMLNKDLPNKWAIFLDAQGKPQPIVAAQRDDGPAPNNGGGGGNWGPGAGNVGAVKPQWEGFG